ncbi:MAG: hypothetical protein CO164_02720 [Rhodocyclales bacterium CG_4_9_14_3_um_filter_68_10]|nr:MAG: hypothetical protein CO164_02720 [Rhodocyclales bacterium CG_4_9_14_3_um_filter_68_10]
MRPIMRKTPSDVSPVMLAALRRVLGSLVRILLGYGIRYPVLLELLKSEFVRAADLDFSLGHRAQSDSRISLLTGVHRKDVRRLRAQPPGEDEAPASVSLGGSIVAKWLATRQCVDSRGRPAPLPRLRRQGGERSFEALVESVSKDMRSRVVLDEWLRLGVARIDDADRVCLNVSAFVPKKGLDEKAHYFGRNAADHLSAIAANLAGPEPRFVERSVHYTRLSAAAVGKLAQLAERDGMKALHSINRRAAELKAASGRTQGPLHRMNFGIYFYSEPEAEPPSTGRTRRA